MTSSRGPFVRLAAAAAAPVVAATLGVFVFALAETRGTTLMSTGAPLNIAEAAGMGDGAQVLRFLWLGHDANRLLPVRGEVIASRITRVTALEAAVWSRRVQLIELFDRHGAIVGDDSRRHLGCLAAAIGAADIVEYLTHGAPVTCPPDLETEIVARGIDGSS